MLGVCKPVYLSIEDLTDHHHHIASIGASVAPIRKGYKGSAGVAGWAGSACLMTSYEALFIFSVSCES